MWDGVFLPRLQKRVTSSRFLPLNEMNNADWDWLDYRNLRNAAKNRLASQILRCMPGFIDVEVTPPPEPGPGPGPMPIPGPSGKRVGKPRYLWPATREDAEGFQSGEHDFFRYDSDVEDLSQEAEIIDEAIFTLSTYSRALLLSVLLSMLTSEMVAQKDALEKSDALSDENFLLLAVIVIGLISCSSNTGFAVVLEGVEEELDRAGGMV